MKNILITGGAGFIGSHLVRLMVNKYPEYRIINLDKLTYAGNLANLKDIEKKPNYVFEKADICDFPAIQAIFEKYQVHIARWDVATVAAEIESALKIQEDLEQQAKARLIADKKEARREKFDKLKANIKEKFSKKN